MASEFFGKQRECRFYTAGCGNKMAVSVTGPRAVNELGGPVIPGKCLSQLFLLHLNTYVNVCTPPPPVCYAGPCNLITTLS